MKTKIPWSEFKFNRVPPLKKGEPRPGSTYRAERRENWRLRNWLLRREH